MNPPDLLELVRGRLSGAAIVEVAQAYRRYPLQLSFSSYARGIEWIASGYRDRGLDAEVIPFPADGRTVYADRHFPLAWDVEAGWARVCEPDFAEPELANYSVCSYGIVPFSADSGGEQEGRVVPAEVLLHEGVPGPHADTVALFDRRPSSADVRRVMDLGCKAFLACARADPVHASGMDARQWFNAAFGDGQIDARHRTICGFSLTPRQVLSLLDHYKRHGPVRVRYLLKSRTYEGTAPTVTATIPGVKEPGRSVFVTAHAYEPNTTNNVAGVAACLEAARCLQAFIRSGALPQPRRTIRFFHGLEVWGLYAYAMEHRAEMARALGGLTIDSLGRMEFEGDKERLMLWRCPTLRPSFIHAVAEEFLRLTAQRAGLEFGVCDTSSNNDDLMQDPMLGPPWVMLYGTHWRKEYYYHSSTDTPDKLSPQCLAEHAAWLAATAYFTASAGPDESPALAKLTCESWRRSVVENCRNALGNPDVDREAARARGQRLAAWGEIAAQAGTSAIGSAAEVVPEKQRDAFMQEARPLAEEYRSFAEAQIQETLDTLAASAGEDAARFFRPRLGEAEREAARIIPSRQIPGPIGLGTIPEELRHEAERAVGWPSKEYWIVRDPGSDLYWLEGRRSVLDAAKAVWATRPLNFPGGPATFDEVLRDISALVDLLDRCGYLRIERRLNGVEA